MDDLKKRRYWELKEEALDHNPAELALEEAVELLYDRLRVE